MQKIYSGFIINGEQGVHKILSVFLNFSLNVHTWMQIVATSNDEFYEPISLHKNVANHTTSTNECSIE